MKYTLLVTQQCNLDCGYCYIGKKNERMSLEVAAAIVDLIFERTPPYENIDIGFFGGEPLLAFELIESVTSIILSHRSYSGDRVTLSLVTNGTILSEAIVQFIGEHDVDLCVSADGPPSVHDRFRRTRTGRGTAAVVEKTLTAALQVIPGLAVNAVYGPDTLSYLPDTVSYFADLGVKRIFLNPDYSADWTGDNIESLPSVLGSVGEQYCEYYLREDPRFISILDNKITVLLRGGYDPIERCRMGKGELAFAPTGNIYPCERLVGGDDGIAHCLGNVFDGFQADRMSCHTVPGGEVNDECAECGIRDFCTNWCGCSNYFSSGYYNRVGTVLCATERAAVKVAFEVYQRLETELGGVFLEHLGGRPYAAALAKI